MAAVVVWEMGARMRNIAKVSDMTQDELKRAAAQAALDYVVEGSIVGVGTGSTANHFIDGLAGLKGRITGAVASSEASAERLASHGIKLIRSQRCHRDANLCRRRRRDRRLAGNDQGRGGALTREKIVAAVAGRFVCICDESKRVEVMGRFPLPIEVIPMARAQVTRELIALGGAPKLREGFVTDNGNLILDVHGLAISDPAGLETTLNQIVGVVTNGLFARRGADILLLATSAGVKRISRP